jgi:FtsZ-interacting cell division protein ZipA
MQSKKTLIVVGIIIAIVAVVGFFFWLNKKRLARLTAEAPAEVLSVTLERNRTTRNSNGRRKNRTDTETDIRYRFAVEGKPIAASTSKSGDVTGTYKVGMQAKACYNPSNPAESEVFAPDHKCGQ